MSSPPAVAGPEVRPSTSATATANAAVTTLLLLLLTGTITYGLIRPGCSLLPVNPPALDQAMPATVAEACAALGEPLPLPRYLPDGYRRLGIGVSAAHPLVPSAAIPVWAVPRAHVAYGPEHRRAAMRLTAMRTTFPNLRPTQQIGPHRAEVSGTAIAEGIGDRAYMFAVGGLLLTVHVRVDGDVTPEVADRIIASIR